MTEKNLMRKIQSNLQTGMNLQKCRKCGCMRETLDNLLVSRLSLQTKGSYDLLKNIEQWHKQMEPIKYSCLGCKYCYPMIAINIFNHIFPEAASQSLSGNFEAREQTWPPIPGEYFALCDGQDCPVAVSTLASVELAEKLASIRPKELCIVGKTETENIGIEKVIKNTITNSAIHFLLLVGKDPQGHHSGKTILALWENGVDENMRVKDSPGKRPILINLTIEEVEAFRMQVQVVDLIGCEDVDKIIEKIKELSLESSFSIWKERTKETKPIQIFTIQVIQAQEPDKVEMDKGGYFVIIPQPEKKIITVEHYSNNNKLLRVIESKYARNIYWMVIKNGWITQLSHAAYLGKELMKAELSIKLGFKYVQEGA